MEPLLAKEGKEGLSPLFSPGYRVYGTGSAVLSSLFVRKRQVLTVLAAAAVLLAAVSGTRSFARRVADRQHVFDLSIRTTTEPFVEVDTPQQLYSWSTEKFLPPAESSLAYLNASLAQLRGHQRNAHPAKEHTLSLYPSVQDFSALPDSVRPEEIVFGFTSPYHRARDMCRTWRHYLRHGSQCLITLPPEEYMYVRDMKYYLEKEGLGRCHVLVHNLPKHGRYEHRVMDQPRRMQQEEFLDDNGKKIIPKWYVVADDDSQILDLQILQREMASRRHDEDHMRKLFGMSYPSKICR